MKPFFLLLSLFLINQTFATECFEFQINGNPERQIESVENIRKETWCYMPLTGPDFETMIFNYENSNITANLGLLVGKNGKNENSKFLYYDQLYGKIRVIEQIGSDFNPYQIPLSSIEVKNAGKGKGFLKKFFPNFSVSQIQKIDEMITHMITSDRKILNFSEKLELDSINNDLGKKEIRLPEDMVPPGGYWWPHNGIPLARPDLSPIHLYDLFVKSITGKDPLAREWELKNHSLEKVAWGGHCNGWAASSILHGFYEKGLIMNLGDKRGDIIINPSDIQGMRTETSFCVKMAFYGTRYRDSKDDITDIHPELFHKVLKYYLKNLGKPIVLDSDPGESVNNLIFSGFTMGVDKISETKYHVEVSARTHSYNHDLTYLKLPSQSEDRFYSYFLFTDEKGNIKGGEWIVSYHPDFLWVPLTQMNCGRENPRMDPSYIDQMINTLPKGNYQIEPMDHRFPLKIAPGETKRITLNLEKDYIDFVRVGSQNYDPRVIMKFTLEDKFGNQKETPLKFSYISDFFVHSKKIKAMEVYNFFPSTKILDINFYQINFLTDLEK